MAYLNIEDRRAYQRRYRKKHRAKLNAYARRYMAAMREKFPSHRSAYKRAYDLRRKYGLTEDQIQAKLEDQKGCAICSTMTPTHGGRWQVDHCHAARKVRGILCSACNLMLGITKDNPAILRKAIVYLRKHK